MNIQNASSFIHFLIGILGLYLLWHYGYRPYLLDKFRSELFDLRDNLFDYARDGNISFNDSKYGSIRIWLNSSIRLAHRFTILDTLLMTHFAKSPKGSSSIEGKINTLEEITKGEHGKDLQSFALKSFIIIGKYFVLRSPLMWIAFIFALLSLAVRDFFRTIRNSKDLAPRTLAWFGRKTEDQVRLSNPKSNSESRKQRHQPVIPA